jgi:hypothetical protein
VALTVDLNPGQAVPVIVKRRRAFDQFDENADSTKVADFGADELAGFWRFFHCDTPP